MTDNETLLNDFTNKISDEKTDKNLKKEGNFPKKNTNKRLSIINYNEYYQQGDQLFMSTIAILLKTIRPISDIRILIDYLKSLPEFSNMMKSVSDNFEDLLYNVASALKYERVPGERVTIKFGEKGKKFYIILRGCCSVLLPKQESFFLTQESYYDYILRLKKYKESEFLNKVLVQNKNVYPLNEDEVSWLCREISTLKGKINLSPFENYLYRFAQQEGIEDLDNLNFDIWKIFEKNQYNFESAKYEQKIINADDYIEKLMPNKSLNKLNQGKEVIVWIYHNLISLNTGETFGDLALTSTTQKRTATIVTDTECHFGILDKKSFIKSLKDVSDKAKRRDMRFILSQKVFSSINENIFHRCYFNQFVNRKLNIGDVLIKEDQEADNIYIIKNGQFEVTIKKSNVELYRLIRKLGVDSKKLFEEMDLIFENKEYIDFMTLPKTAKIEIINETDIIGLDDIILENKFIFTIKLTSLKGEVFELKRNFFEGMYKFNEEIRKSNKEFCHIKRNYWFERIKTTVESRIQFFKTFKQETLFTNKSYAEEKIDLKKIKNSNFNDLVFKNKITLNSTFCLSPKEKTFFLKEKIQEVKEEKRRNKSFENSHSDIVKKIYAKAIKDNPQEKRKQKLAELKKKNKSKTKRLKDSILNVDLNLTKKPINTDVVTDFNNFQIAHSSDNWRNNKKEFYNNNNYYSDNFFEKNEVELKDYLVQKSSNCDKINNVFKTSLNNENLTNNYEEIKNNYFSFEKINNNPEFLKKEILNNLLYYEGDSNKIRFLNKTTNRFSNTQINYLLNENKDINHKAQLTNTYSYKFHNPKIKLNQVKYSNQENNNFIMDPVDEEGKDMETTRILEKNYQTKIEKIHSNKNQEKSSNTIFNSNAFLNVQKTVTVSENERKKFEAPIFSGITINKMEFENKKSNILNNIKIYKNKINEIENKSYKSIDGSNSYNNSEINSIYLTSKYNKEFKNKTVNFQQEKEYNLIKEYPKLFLNQKTTVVEKATENTKQKPNLDSYRENINPFYDIPIPAGSKRLEIKNKILNVSSTEFPINFMTIKNKKIKKIYNRCGKLVDITSPSLMNFSKEKMTSKIEYIPSRKGNDNKKFSNLISNLQNKFISFSTQEDNYIKTINKSSSKNVQSIANNGDDKSLISPSKIDILFSQKSYNDKNEEKFENFNDEENIINSNSSFEDKKMDINLYDRLNFKNTVSDSLNGDYCEKDLNPLINVNGNFNFHNKNMIEISDYKTKKAYNNDYIDVNKYHKNKFVNNKNQYLGKLGLKNSIISQNSTLSNKTNSIINKKNKNCLKNVSGKNGINCKISNVLTNDSRILKDLNTSISNNKINYLKTETLFTESQSENQNNNHDKINSNQRLFTFNNYKNMVEGKNSNKSIDILHNKVSSKYLNSETDKNKHFNLKDIKFRFSKNEENKFTENKQKMYLIDELDKVTEVSKYKNYSKKQSLNKIVYDKIFSEIFNAENPRESKSLKEKPFIDYLAIDKLNEIFSKSFKNTMGFLKESEIDYDVNLHTHYQSNKINKNRNLLEKIKNSSFNNSKISPNKNFEISNKLNFLSNTSFPDFKDLKKYKSTTTSRSTIREKALKIYEPKKIISLVSPEKDSTASNENI